MLNAGLSAAAGGMAGSAFTQLATTGSLSVGNTLKAGLTSGLTAGLTQGITGAGSSASWSQFTTDPSTYIGNALIKAGVSAGVSTAINGGSFGTAFGNSLVTQAAATAANGIGQNFHGIGVPDSTVTSEAENIGLHAIVGCASASLQGQSCEAGAVGAATSAIVAEPILNSLYAGSQNNDSSVSYTNSTYNAIGLALSSGISGAVATAMGLNGGVAVNAGVNKFENNAEAPKKCNILFGCFNPATGANPSPGYQAVRLADNTYVEMPIGPTAPNVPNIANSLLPRSIPDGPQAVPGRGSQYSAIEQAAINLRYTDVGADNVENQVAPILQGPLAVVGIELGSNLTALAAISYLGGSAGRNINQAVQEIKAGDISAGVVDLTSAALTVAGIVMGINARNVAANTSGVAVDGAGSAINAPKTIPYQPSGSVTLQGNAPVCGPACAAMTITDNTGASVSLENAIGSFQNGIRPTGVSTTELSSVISNAGVTNTVSTNMLPSELNQALNSGQTVIVNVNSHFFIVDAITTVDGVPYYMTRDPLVGPRGVLTTVLDNAMKTGANAIVIGKK